MVQDILVEGGEDGVRKYSRDSKKSAFIDSNIHYLQRDFPR